jgi:hypothetical protein
LLFIVADVSGCASCATAKVETDNVRIKEMRRQVFIILKAYRLLYVKGHNSL